MLAQHTRLYPYTMSSLADNFSQMRMYIDFEYACSTHVHVLCHDWTVIHDIKRCSLLGKQITMYNNIFRVNPQMQHSISLD